MIHISEETDAAVKLALQRHWLASLAARRAGHEDAPPKPWPSPVSYHACCKSSTTYAAPAEIPRRCGGGRSCWRQGWLSWGW